MKDISQILKSLGLVDSEIKTYLQALQRGPSTVLDLSKYTELSRQATYVAIESLTERGLMSSVLRGKKHYYAAEEPNKLLAYADRRRKEMDEQISDLKRAVPELELQVGGEKPVVRVYEGKEGIQAMLEDIRAHKPKQLEEIGDLDAIFSVLKLDDLKQYRDTFAAAKVKISSIYAGEPKTKGHNPNRFFLPNKAEFQNFKTNVIISEKSITLTTFSGRMFSIIIEDPNLVRTLHILFKLALDNGKDILRQG